MAASASPGFDTWARYHTPDPEDENLQRDRMRARKAARIARSLKDQDYTLADITTYAQDEEWRDRMARVAVNRTASPHTWATVIGFLEATEEEGF